MQESATEQGRDSHQGEEGETHVWLEIPFIQTSAELQSFECNNHNDLHVKLKAWGPDAAR